MSTISARLIVTGALLCNGGSAFAQANGVPPDTLITMQRTSCLVGCPTYTVSIDASGQVTFDGTTNVRVQGRHTDRIPASRVAALLTSVERLGFFGLSDRDRENVEDVRTTIVTVTRQGQTKRVEDQLGAPSGLREFETEIDEAARARRWIFLDAEMLREMVAAGWRPAPVEAADLLRKALTYDDVRLIERILEPGIDPNSREGQMSSPPVYEARSAAAVRLLVDAGADPNNPDVDSPTPLGHSAHLPGEVAQALKELRERLDVLRFFPPPYQQDFSGVMLLLEAAKATRAHR